MSDFGFREGFAQLGSFKRANGVVYVYARRGNPQNPAVGTVEAWIAAYGPWTLVRLSNNYEATSYVERYPVRAALKAGETASLPSVEADALVAAGIAAYA